MDPVCLEELDSYERDVSMLSVPSIIIAEEEETSIAGLEQGQDAREGVVESEEVEEDFVTRMITVKEIKEGEVLDGFAIYGYNEDCDGVVIKYVGNKGDITGSFEFSRDGDSGEKGYEGDLDDDEETGEERGGEEEEASGGKERELNASCN